MGSVKKVFIHGRGEHDFNGALNAKDCLEVKETNAELHMQSLNRVSVEEEVGQNKQSFVKVVSVEMYCREIELLLVMCGKRG